MKSCTDLFILFILAATLSSINLNAQTRNDWENPQVPTIGLLAALKTYGNSIIVNRNLLPEGAYYMKNISDTSSRCRNAVVS